MKKELAFKLNLYNTTVSRRLKHFKEFEAN